MKKLLPELKETTVNLIGSEAKLKGEFTFPDETRIHGSIKGTLHMTADSNLYLEESSRFEGEIEAATIWISGYVKGKVLATHKISLSPSARVFGDLSAPKIEISFGAFFEGSSSTRNSSS